MYRIFLITLIATFQLSFSDVGLADEILMIDAHSQLPGPSEANKIIELMDKAGVRRTILSFRGSAKWRHVRDLAKRHPRRIIPAIKIKGKHWPRGNKKFFTQIEKQMKKGTPKAMGEALLYHAAKGNRAPEWSVRTDSKQFKHVLELCRKNKWPLIVHIEFRAVKEPVLWMKRLEDLLTANRDVAFPLIHMGQLKSEQVERLIKAHPNVYFMVSHSNTVVVSQSRQPWINLFNGRSTEVEVEKSDGEPSRAFYFEF